MKLGAPVMAGQVAIHQPNFLPWLGYFDKIVRSDVFVLLDDAAMTKTGGNWTNRCRIRVSEVPAWLTMPVHGADRDTLPIAQLPLARGPWRRKVLETLRIGYARAPFFRSVFELLEPLVQADAETVGDYNERMIRALGEAMGLSLAHLVRASTLEVAERSTSRLVAIVKRVGGNRYLSGDGAGGYQEPELFANAGIALVQQCFVHPEYAQRWQPFCAGLSIVDALMNAGVAAVGAWLRQPLPRPPRIGSEGE